MNSSSLPIQYGRVVEHQFLLAGQRVLQTYNSSNIFQVAEQINEAFFGGGALAPKSFSHLASVKIPVFSERRYQAQTGGNIYVQIRDELSLSSMLGYMEMIPYIGSAIAVIAALGHLYYMITSYFVFTQAVTHLQNTPFNPDNMHRGFCTRAAKDVLEAATSYTTHQNLLVGSLIAMIPYVKPTVRMMQAGIYYQTEQTAPR
jgi:hypothetical protein